LKAEITLELRTREVYKLFERKISGDRLFIDAILHKINVLLNRCRMPEAHSINLLHEREKQLLALTRKFSDEIARFEALLEKKKELRGKQINFVVQFNPQIIVSNPVSMKLVEFIEVYDRLITILKLLRLAGCFDIDETYFSQVKQQQRLTNQMLSKFIVN